MNVTFEKKDALTGVIQVNISSADYLPQVEKQLKEFQKKANIPGFRPGHAPKGMIEKMYGSSVLLEEVNATSSKALYDYIETNKLQILGQPVITPDTEIKELTKTADYTLKFDIGLAPDFDLNISANDVFTKYVVKVDDKMLAEEVERMRARGGNLVDVEQAGENDLVYGSLTELNDDGSVLEGGVHVDSVPISMQYIKNEELKATLISAAKGTELTVNIFALFDNNEGEISHALGVQKVGVKDLGPSFKFIVKEIKHTETAELNQEFFDKVYGKDVVKSVEEMQERIKAELQGYFVQQAEHLFEHELFDTLVAKHNIPLPDDFLKRWLMDRHTDKFNNDNIEHTYLHEAEYLRNHLFEEKVLTTNNLKVEEQDIRAAAISQTKQMFGGYAMSELNDDLLNSIIEPSLKKDEYRSRMINIAAREKVNAYIKMAVGVTEQEVSAEEFTKLVAEHNHAHHNHQH